MHKQLPILILANFLVGGLANAAELICLPDVLAGPPSSTVTIRAQVFAAALEFDAEQIEWEPASAAETVSKSPSGARWTVGPAPGYARITGSLPVSGGDVLTCSIEVFVTQPVLSLSETRKYFLVADEEPLEGFASYSYLLIGARLNPNLEQDRRAVLGAFLQRIEELSTLDELGPSGVKNLFMIPVNETPPPFVHEDPYSDAATEWLLRNFNYRRAQQILGQEGVDSGVGPFIVSVRTVMRDSREVAEKLIQDMTNAHGPVAELWVDLHITRSAHEDDWNSTSFAVYGTHVLNALSVFSEAVPTAVQSVGNAASWIVRIADLGR